MVTQVERLWLFETVLVDPFQFDKVDGVEVVMANNRIIQTLNIDTAVYFISTIAKSGFQYSKSYGGEDTDVEETFGKTTTDFKVSFNVPLLSHETLDRLIGREYSFLAMRRDLTYFACFGRFRADNVTIDNDVQQRITLTCSGTQAKLFDVLSYNFNIIEDEITIDNPSGNIGGFDYEFDYEFD